VDKRSVDDGVEDGLFDMLVNSIQSIQRERIHSPSVGPVQNRTEHSQRVPRALCPEGCPVDGVPFRGQLHLAGMS
jgi:hypothetical protein